jgi:hypothetical protein
MKLPLEQAPAGWRISESAGSVRIEKVPKTGVGREQFVAVGIASAFILTFGIGVQWLSSERDLYQALLGWPTFGILVPIGVMGVLLYYGRRNAKSEKEFILEPGRVTVSSQFGEERDRQSVERNRILRFVRSTDEETDEDGDRGFYLEFEYRGSDGENAELYLGSFWSLDEADWFTRLFERWSGQRAREEIVEDDEEDDLDTDEDEEVGDSRL